MAITPRTLRLLAARPARTDLPCRTRVNYEKKRSYRRTTGAVSPVGNASSYITTVTRRLLSRFYVFFLAIRSIALNARTGRTLHASEINLIANPTRLLTRITSCADKFLAAINIVLLRFMRRSIFERACENSS